MTGLYRTDTEALDECLLLMFPDCEADDFRTDGGNINMPKVRSLWAERRAASSAPASGVNPSDDGEARLQTILEAWDLAELRAQEKFGDRVKGSVRSSRWRDAEALRAAIALLSDGVGGPLKGQQ